jgi:hypothetical protein
MATLFSLVMWDQLDRRTQLRQAFMFHQNFFPESHHGPIRILELLCLALRLAYQPRFRWDVLRIVHVSLFQPTRWLLAWPRYPVLSKTFPSDSSFFADRRQAPFSVSPVLTDFAFEGITVTR